MIFSSEFWPIALLWAFIAAGVSAALAFQGGDRTFGSSYDRNQKTVKAKSLTITAAIVAFVLALLVVRFTMYYVQPVFQGSFFGYFALLFASLVPALAVGMTVNGFQSKRAWVATVTAVVVLFGGSFGQYAFNAWGPSNALRHAALPNITTAGDKDLIPPTDPDRMVLVTKSIAIFRGQAALSTKNNIASRYSINPETYTLQAVKGHRYWIAPLTPANNGDTFWSPLFGNYATTPGYVVVDAEDPEKDAELKTGFNIRLFVDQKWVNNLERFVYQQGFKDGILDEPIFEVDDNWVPHYTIGYISRPFGGVSGKKLEKVIAVDVAAPDAKITVYELKDKPTWVDRVVSDDLVKEYATDWGMYGGEFARENTWSVIFGNNKTGTMEPADIELAYTKDEHNAWVVPMTSTVEGDHTVVGVLVFESSENKGVFYPGLTGFNVGSSVVETMQNARDNIKHYPVESVQLYSIYGELTWVAIYAAPQSIGKSFGGIGIMRAHTQNAADVIYANDKQTALRLYATQLARTKRGGESISQTVQQSKEITGNVQRIALLPSSNNGGSPTYMFVLEGDSRIYLVSRDSYARIPLVKDGDEVVFTFLDTNSQETAVNTFHCKTLDGKLPAKPAQPAEVEKK